MKRILEWVFRISGVALAVSAATFMTIPSASEFKKVMGILCAIFGLVCIVSMYFTKKPGHTEEIHAVNRELRHHESDDGDPH